MSEIFFCQGCGASGDLANIQKHQKMEARKFTIRDFKVVRYQFPKPICQGKGILSVFGKKTKVVEGNLCLQAPNLCLQVQDTDSYRTRSLRASFSLFRRTLALHSSGLWTRFSDARLRSQDDVFSETRKSLLCIWNLTSIRWKVSNIWIATQNTSRQGAAHAN